MTPSEIEAMSNEDIIALLSDRDKTIDDLQDYAIEFERRVDELKEQLRASIPRPVVENRGDRVFINGHEESQSPDEKNAMFRAQYLRTALGLETT